MEGIEIGVSIDAQDDGFPIDDELLLTVLQGGIDYDRIIAEARASGAASAGLSRDRFRRRWPSRGCSFP
jgi:hypothetical protein